jgi:hypothetical protein
MVTRLSNIAKTAAAFLQTGVAPPNTPKSQKKEMEDTNHLASKKFFIAFSGFLILGVFYSSSIAVLFMMSKSPELIAAYSVLFSKTIEVFATIMAVYLGGQALVDLRYSSSSNAEMSANTQIIDVTTKQVGNEKEDDYVLHD